MDPVHVAVAPDGQVVDAMVMDVETAQLFDRDGHTAALWPDCELVEVTGANPRPGIGWTRQGEGWEPPSEPTPDPASDEPAG